MEVINGASLRAYVRMIVSEAKKKEAPETDPFRIGISNESIDSELVTAAWSAINKNPKSVKLLMKLEAGSMTAVRLMDRVGAQLGAQRTYIDVDPLQEIVKSMKEKGPEVWAKATQERCEYESKFMRASFYTRNQYLKQLALCLPLMVGSEKKADVVPLEKAEAKPDDPLGQIAFAPERPKEVPYEPNTKVEQKLFDDIIRHFDENYGMTKDEANLLKSFLTTGKYNNVFKEPPQKELYRGMTVDKKWLTAIIGKEPGNKGSKRIDKVIEPRTGAVTSWTADYGTAVEFSTEGPKPYSVILFAKKSDNPKSFLTGPGGLYDIEPFSAYRTEDEVIGLGGIKVLSIDWERNGID